MLNRNFIVKNYLIFKEINYEWELVEVVDGNWFVKILYMSIIRNRI